MSAPDLPTVFAVSAALTCVLVLVNSRVRDSRPVRENDSPRGEAFAIVCAWCSTVQRISGAPVEPGNKIKVSHGMCSACAAKFESENETNERVQDK